MMNYQAIGYTRDGPVATITLNQPERLNPVNPGMVSEIRNVLAQVRAEKTIRALLVTAVGRVFCSGADLKDTAFDSASASRGEQGAAGMRAGINPMIAELHELPVPVVVALNGAAAGAGVGLALAGDITLAANSAYFYLPFIKTLGIVPDGGASWFLQRRLGSARALGLSLTGERLSAQKAEQWGLIHACVDNDQLFSAAMEMAQQLARLPAHGVIEARRAFDVAGQNDLRQQLDYEADRQRELLDLPTLDEGVRSFFEKRQPNFPDRA